MGHKVHPKIFRIGTLYQWNSRWFSRRDFASFLRQDMVIKKFLKKELKDAAVSQVDIERSPSTTTVIIHSAKPGVIIGRGGQGLDQIRKDIERNFLKMSKKVKLNIQEVSNPSLSAQIVAESVARDTEGRLPFRRVMKQHMERVMKAGALGVKIAMGGRLNGVEIARREKLAQGKIPLITLRSNIDYAHAIAKTIYGTIGIKVWIYKGEHFGQVDALLEASLRTKPAK